MKAKQISVFWENTSSQLADCLGILSENDITIHAMSLVDTKKSGVLHFVVDDPDKASKLFRKNGMGVGESDVMLVTLPDQTKSLQSFLQTFTINKNINIEYMYMGSGRKFVFRFDNLDSALHTLNQT